MARSDYPKQPPKPPVPMLPTDTLLFHAEVRKVIRLALRDVGIRDHELPQLEADVIAECWEDRLMEADPPDSIQRWQAYVRPRAKHMGIDVHRKRQTQAEGHAKIAATDPSSETPGSSGRDKMDVDRALGEFDRMPKHPHATALFDAVQSGDGPSAASEELGLGKQQAHNIVSSTRERYVKWLRAAGMVAILPAGVSMWLLFFRAPVDLEGRRPDGYARIDESLPAPPLAETLAPGVRAKAADECAKEQWGDCERDLDLAYQMDQAGNLAPEVQAMRMQIIEANNLREMNAKPGYFRPPPKKK
jgi:hypothetical protein